MFIQNRILKSDIEAAKQKITAQEQTITNQKDVIQAQSKTIELSRDMEAVKSEVLENYSKRLDTKLKDTNDLIKQIQGGTFQPPKCEPSDSIKAVVNHIQEESSK